MTISFIIPCYNVEHFIIKCINSIKLDIDFEIIAVDDGSSDNTLLTLKKISEQNKSLRIISKENEGVLAARRDGWRIAQGEYICFVDADDEIDGRSLCRILKDNFGNDMIRCGGCRVNGLIKSKISGSFKGYISDGKEAIVRLMNEEMLPFMWGVLYKRTLLDDNCFLLDSRFKIGEDFLFNIMAMKKASNIYCTDNFFYYYNFNETSVMRTKIWSCSYIRDFNHILKSMLLSVSPTLSYYADRHRFKDYIGTLFLVEIPYDKNLYNEAMGLLDMHPEFIDNIPTKRRLFIRYEYLFRIYLYLQKIYKRLWNNRNHRILLD